MSEINQVVSLRPAFWNNSKRFYDLKSFWRNRFGCKVYKLPIDLPQPRRTRGDRRLYLL
jgi:hypothetical protein